MPVLKSALFWRILVSFLLVVSVLGWGLMRAVENHEELDSEFDRLVQHDLKLADHAEVLLRMMADLETGKRGYLLNHDKRYLEPYDVARRDIVQTLEETRRIAVAGREGELVESFARDLDEWLATVATPQLAGVTSDEMERKYAIAGKALIDSMRATLGQLRDGALADAQEGERRAFYATAAARRSTVTVIAIAIAIALALGIAIARDTAQAARQLQDGLAATGRLEPLPSMPRRRDELGDVADSLRAMAALLVDKDASLRATLAERERTLSELTKANAELGARDAAGRAYARFVAQLKTLDLPALARGGLEGLVGLAAASSGAVYLLRGDGLARIHAIGADAGPSAREGAIDAIALRVMNSRDPELLTGDGAHALGAIDHDEGGAWILASPVAVAEEAAGCVVVTGAAALSKAEEEIVRDAARQLGVALHNAWTHERLREKTMLLEDQGRELYQASRVKNEFLAAMSHELRTPLSAMIGFAALLLDSPREPLSPRARESLERIRRNGEHLLSLINDVLDLARVEAGRLEVKAAPCNVVQVARASVAEVDSLRRGKADLRLEFRAPKEAIELPTDSKRLKQILLNLLSNALKFTERGRVSLRIVAGDAWVEFHVEDTGMGIPERAIDELFREFHQLDVGDGRRFDGSGIGLALSRKLALALGGDIRVVSREGEGSTFTLVLPRAGMTETFDAGTTAQVA